jgi:hypothetical protein
MPAPLDEAALRCPSAQPDMAEAQILGVMSWDGDEPRLAYLNAHVPATPEILARAGSVAPTEVFRLAARCEEKRCTHFDGTRCQLAVRIVERLPAVTEALPPCAIRRTCRWYAQEGRAACLRCPQILTTNVEADEGLIEVAGVGPRRRRSPGHIARTS